MLDEPSKPDMPSFHGLMTSSRFFSPKLHSSTCRAAFCSQPRQLQLVGTLKQLIAGQSLPSRQKQGCIVKDVLTGCRRLGLFHCCLGYGCLKRTQKHCRDSLSPQAAEDGPSPVVEATGRWPQV